MEAHQLGHAKVNYYDRALGREMETDMYFRYLPNKGDRVTIFLKDDREVEGRVSSIHHHAQSWRELAPDITIYLESL